MANWSSDPDDGRYEIYNRKLGKMAAASVEVTVDVADVLEPMRIECKWVEYFKPGHYGVRVHDARRVGRPWHKLTVVAHRLVCDCKGYQYSNAKQRSCRHLTGVDLVSGAAGWLEAQAPRLGLAEGQIAFCLSTHNDPHRLAARHLLRQRLVAKTEERTGKPVSLESLFDL